MQPRAWSTCRTQSGQGFFLFYVYFFNELLLRLVSCFLLGVFYFRICFPIYMRIVEHFNQFWRLIKISFVDLSFPFKACFSW